MLTLNIILQFQKIFLLGLSLASKGLECDVTDMGVSHWRDSSIDSGYATDKTERDVTNSVEAAGQSERYAEPEGGGCCVATKKLQQLGLALRAVKGKGLGLVALRGFARGEVAHGMRR